MGLMDAQDEVGKVFQEKREADKLKQEAEEKTKEDAQKQAEQHEENKRQGML
jgi:hypothetical protein